MRALSGQSTQQATWRSFAINRHGRPETPAADYLVVEPNNGRPHRCPGGVSEAEASLKHMCFMNCPTKSDVHARQVSLLMLIDLFGGPAKREIAVSLSRPWPRETHGAPELCPAEWSIIHAEPPCIRFASAARAGLVGFRHSPSRADLVSPPDPDLCREIARGRPRRTSDGVFRNHSATRQA